MRETVLPQKIKNNNVVLEVVVLEKKCFLTIVNKKVLSLQRQKFKRRREGTKVPSFL